MVRNRRTAIEAIPRCDSLAQQALELGLIDRLGALSDAIKHVAEQAKIEKYEIRFVPRSKSFIEQLLVGLTGDDAELSGEHKSRRDDLTTIGLSGI